MKKGKENRILYLLKKSMIKLQTSSYPWKKCICVEYSELIFIRRVSYSIRLFPRFIKTFKWHFKRWKCAAIDLLRVHTLEWWQQMAYRFLFISARTGNKLNCVPMDCDIKLNVPSRKQPPSLRPLSLSLPAEEDIEEDDMWTAAACASYKVSIVCAST